MNAFASALEKHDLLNSARLKRSDLSTLQINMGDLCNQACLHCHIEASPSGKKIMSRQTVQSILKFLKRFSIVTLDITGGAPEMNPHFKELVKGARPLVKDLIIRCNLTIILEDGMEDLAEFYQTNRAHLVCSLPCYLEKNVDAQRGLKVFKRSIQALKILNELGYGTKDTLFLDLIYNPVGPILPPKQDKLQEDYKRVLLNDYGIHFNRLMTLTNVPIKRFKVFLENRGEYDKYCGLLQENFNPRVVDNLMCRTFLSVGFDGRLYDCDFNLALDLAIRNQKGELMRLDEVSPSRFKGRDIMMGEHCLACTAGSGSSCQGAIEK